MSKLPCGCTPDGSGFGYCGECTRNLRAKIWREMSEERKDFDRHVDPQGSADLDEGEYNTGCSCHIDPPCSYCVDQEEESYEDNKS